MLRAKQPRYPVVMLVESPDEQMIFPDARGITLHNVLDYVTHCGLQGIALESSPLREEPSIVEKAKSLGLILMTWGNNNSDTSYVQYQRDLGVDVVRSLHMLHLMSASNFFCTQIISDNIGDHTAKRGYGLSAFDT